MKIFYFYLKSLFSILNVFLILFLASWYLRRRGLRKASLLVLWILGILFFIFSTPFLPRYLCEKLETQYWPLSVNTLSETDKPVYIHVLGSGHGLDNRLPASSQLPPVAKGRLMEGLRLFHQIPSSILVCSAGSVTGMEAQASVTRKAAILLGADSSRIIRLDKPLTTVEEAESLKEQLGTTIRLILVTDAMHMPRAMDAFRKKGFDPMASPTNYKVLRASNELPFMWGPSLDNLQLMDQVFHEFGGRIKMNFSF